MERILCQEEITIDFDIITKTDDTQDNTINNIDFSIDLDEESINLSDFK